MSKRPEELMECFGKRMVFMDGGMGTLLQQKGLQGGERPECWNIERPQEIIDIHCAYLAAGCDVVTANTFGATHEHLGEVAQTCMQAGVRLALQATQQCGRGWVAADMGSLGRLLSPYGDLPFEDAVQQFREAFTAGLHAGADLLLIETMTDLLEAKAAVLAAREAMEETGRKVPLFCSLTFDEKGRLLTGADIRGAAAMLCGLGVDAIGLNCGNAPAALYENARELLRWSEAPVFVSPNASLPVVVNGRTTFPTSPADFAQDMQEMARMGVWGLGGCCGTTPEHIEALTRATGHMKPLPRHVEECCVISGRSKSIAMGARPLMIGERLNPTGKPRMKQALKENDIDFLLREAVAQADAGADVLDVNVGLPEVDEPRMLRQVIEAVQTVCELPLQIDTADVNALTAALRSYAGKPLINSVCGKQKVMDEVFPLAAQYGGTLVALLLDEQGIPETAEGRLTIARRIIAEAETYGIHKKELLFDALTMTVSTDEQAAQTTLETVRRLRVELGVKTVLGVSNVSFGLPQRPLLTAAFTAMAIGVGLNAAIMNPLDDVVRTLVDAAVAVSGRDTGFGHYLKAYAEAHVGMNVGKGERCNPAAADAGDARGEASAARQKKPEDACGEAIGKGLAKEAAKQAERLLAEGMNPLEVIERAVMPALGDVGDGYEAGRLFLPQLLQSAQAAQAAFEVIRARLPESSGQSGEKVILATVQGDVHDIGKNIVKVLLQNYGFQVIDLGKDVPPQAVVDAVHESGARIVGLSALMTTTVPAMEATIDLLRKEAPNVRTVVGGAVLTQEYAAQMGADGYGKDAMASVRFAQACSEKDTPPRKNT